MSKKKAVNKKAVIISIFAGVPLVIIAIIMILIVLFNIIILLVIFAYSTPSYNAEKDLKVHGAIDAYMNEYQEKVCVEMTTHYGDSLSIRTAEYTDNWFVNNYGNESMEIILSGDFYREAWHDDKIFIYKDDLFYVFDINEYEVPKADEEPQYELKEYTIFEMEKLYPEFRDFDWGGWGD